MNDLSNVKSLLIVFAMDGCGACHEYLPRLQRMVEGFASHGVPIYFYTSGQVPAGQIPVLVYDGTSEDAQVQALADRFKVEAMPTTVLLAHNAKPVKLEGAIEDDELYRVLVSATIANR